MTEELEYVDFGCDLDDSLEIDPETGDFKIVCGVENAKQGIKNNLLTMFDELAELGYEDYGNNAKHFLKVTDVELALPHIEIYCKEALDNDPRVEEVIDIASVVEDDNIINVYCRLKLVDGTVTDLEAIPMEVFGTGDDIYD